MYSQSGNWRKIYIALSICTGIGLAGTGYYYFTREQGPISSYNEARDTQDIISLFQKNIYWLSNDPNYSVAYMLKHHSSQENPIFWGIMDINVLHEKGTLVGFVTHYMTSKNDGRILFLCVDEQFRGKRYGQKLVEYAINQLVKRGARRIWLCTRVDDLPAQTLYKRVGFTMTERKDGFFYYEYFPSCSQS